MPDTTSQPHEREMTRFQQGLVNSCFEEGQYEAGIAILDQLRSPTCKPSPIHLRALLYIALYPPASLELEVGTLSASPTKMESPRKVRRQKLSQEPSPAATEDALRLLFAFALTNSPEALMRAVPSYDTENGRMAAYSEMDEDSHIIRASHGIAESRCCWDILKEGFIRRMDSHAEGRARKRSKLSEVADSEANLGIAQTVGPHAWPILEWYIDLFEKDQELRQLRGLGNSSELLLSQIPHPKSGKCKRWDGRTALDVAFHCFEQVLAARKCLGTRLTCLIVHLCDSQEVDVIAFMDNLLAHIHTRESNVFNSFLSAIPPTRVGHAFKVLFCRQYLIGQESQSRTKPRPQARAQPRRRGAGSAEVPPPPPAEANRNALSSALDEAISKLKTADMLRLLSQHYPAASRAQSVRVKFELTVAYDSVQKDGAKDVEWTSAIENGSLYQTFDTALMALVDEGDDSENVRDMNALKELLRAMVRP